MKVLRFNHLGREGYGFISKGGVVDATQHLGGRFSTLDQLIGAGATELLAELTAEEPSLPLEAIRFLPPIQRPEKILCAGLNYHAHREETGREENEHPVLFVRFPSSLVGHREPLLRPSASNRYDFEGELAVVIGKRGRNLSPEAALLHIFGYSCFFDGSVRDWQGHSTQFTAGKNFPASGSFGPYITTRDEVPDPGRLLLTTTVNGQVMQSANTAQMIHSVGSLLSYISRFTELAPLDVIATGTPGGVGHARKPPVYLRANDQVEVNIGAVGTLKNRVEDGP